MAQELEQTEQQRAGEPPFEVTPRAVEKAKQKLAEGGGPDAIGLRVGLRGGGCAGYSYVFDFATKLRKRDMMLDFGGLKVVVDDRSAELLRGCTLDWEEKLLGYGFKWVNPNAKAVCGCGTSFNFR